MTLPLPSGGDHTRCCSRPGHAAENPQGDGVRTGTEIRQVIRRHQVGSPGLDTVAGQGRQEQAPREGARCSQQREPPARGVSCRGEGSLPGSKLRPEVIKTQAPPGPTVDRSHPTGPLKPPETPPTGTDRWLSPLAPHQETRGHTWLHPSMSGNRIPSPGAREPQPSTPLGLQTQQSLEAGEGRGECYPWWDAAP